MQHSDYSNLLAAINRNRKYSSDIALHYQDKSYTYAEFFELVDKAVIGILEGIDSQQSSPVVILGENKLHVIVTQLACLLSGHFFSVLDCHTSDEVLNAQIDQISPSLIVSVDHLASDKSQNIKQTNLKLMD